MHCAAIRSSFIRIFLVCLIAALLTSAVFGADCRVTKTADTKDGACSVGDCSLREAVAEPSCTLIDFSLDLVGETIGLTLGEIVIDRSLKIKGFGADALAVSGNDLSRIFYTAPGTTVTISGLTLKNGTGFGTAPLGGGAIASRGPITLDRVLVTNNSSGATGGAIAFRHPSGQVLINSTVTNNVAISGLSSLDGVIIGDPKIVNSTISNNNGPTLASAGLPSVINSTIKDNGTFGVTLFFGALLVTSNSIVENIYQTDQWSGIESGGYNILNAAQGSFGFIWSAQTDLLNVDPFLGPLAYNGGPTPTRILLPGSPAIDRGNNAAVTNNAIISDQRGNVRIFDGDGNGTATVDIGALELNAPVAAPVSVAGRALNSAGRPFANITVSLMDMQGNIHYATTSHLGWFVFEGIAGERVYKLNIESKRYTAPQKVVFPEASVSDADLILSIRNGGFQKK